MRRAKTRWRTFLPAARPAVPRRGSGSPLRGSKRFRGKQKRAANDSLLLWMPIRPREPRSPRFFALVGLLTDAFRRFSASALLRPSLLAITAIPMTRFRDPRFPRAKECSAITATKPEPWRSDTCPGLSPDSLVQLNKNTCPEIFRVAYLPQKLRIQLEARDHFPQCLRKRRACPSAPLSDFVSILSHINPYFKQRFSLTRIFCSYTSINMRPPKDFLQLLAP